MLYITEIYPDVKRGIGVWGGGEKQFYEISRRMANHGHEVMILTCRFPGEPAEETVDGIKIFRVGLSREPSTGGVRMAFFPIFHYILRTMKKAVEKKPDLIHCNTYFPVYAGVLAARLIQVPLVSTFHDIYGLSGWIESQSSFIWGVLGHFTTTAAARLPYKRIISVSPQCKQKLINLGVPECKVSVIPNGVDLALFDSVFVKKVPHQILYVGRLINSKHVDWLIYALSEVLKEVPNAKLKIVGDGPERANLGKLVKTLGLQSYVTFTGVTPTYESVAYYFKESEVFVLPSIVEGEAIVLKEAMAACLPIIAMNVAGSGVLSVVKNGENGFLLKPGKPDLIGKKVVQLLQDEDWRRTMGAKGRKLVENYDWNVITKRTFQVYSEE